MLPLKLQIENFYCHSQSEIDFTQFSSAVIIGNINGNERLSNGTGKSTIFAALKYVLFNEVDTASLDKVIKHNSNHCRVSYEFQSSLDQQIYKIIRFRSKKAGTDVRLFRKLDQDWEDLTQRKSTETEKEIFKLIKINYRTFSNSVLFSQGDLTGIAAMTPRERKIALKEALQLGVYSKYEGLVKKKVSDLLKELEKLQTIVETLGEPEKEIIKLNDSLNQLLVEKNKIDQFISQNEIDVKILTTQLYEKQNKLELILAQDREKNELCNKLKKELSQIESGLTGVMDKLSVTIKIEKENKEKLKLLEEEKNKLLLQQKTSNLESLRLQSTSLKNKISELRAEYGLATSTLKELEIPLPQDAICKHCRQEITAKSRELCQQAISKEIEEVKLKLNQLQQIAKETDSLWKTIQLEIETQENINVKINNLLSTLKIETNNQSHIQNTITTYLIIKEEKIKEKNLKLKELNKTSVSNRDQFLTEIGLLQTEINNLKIEADEANNELKSNFKVKNELSNQEAVNNHQLINHKENLKKLRSFKLQIADIEHQHLIHQKVLTAFGPSGIPTLITHTILDDYQIEANKFLSQLRPGLQLNFSIQKDRESGELADTLEINYLLNGTELEFSQLSGAQKLIASLSLKLGLASIIDKRLGIDLKMLLLDEVDQSLDEGSLESFEQAIKHLQNDYKILLITHNNQLKERFKCAIVVNQDEDLNSTAKLILQK